MVSTPETAQANELSIEWRRHFYDASDGRHLAAALVAAVTTVPLLAAAILADHRSMLLVWGGAALMTGGCAWLFLFRSGTLGERRNSAVFDGEAFRIASESYRQPLIGSIAATVGMCVSAIGLLAAENAGEVFLAANLRVAVWGVLALMLGSLTLSLWNSPFGRHLVVAPGGFSFSIGSTSGEIPWSSIIGMRTHWGDERRMFLPGRVKDSILLDVTDEVRYSGGMGPRPRNGIRVPLIGFDVDEDTLYNVIASLRAHPELRELAGREEGRALFDGPGRLLRKRLRRTEVWLPWERGIHAAVADMAESGNGDRRDLTDHA